MRRSVIMIGVSFAIGALGAASAGAQTVSLEPTDAERRLFQSFGMPPSTFEHEALANGLFVIRNGRSRSLVLIKPTGVVLIDTNRPGLGTALRAKIATLTDKPVTTVINTHSHSGHTGGNVEFGEAKEVVAHANALVRMRAQKEFSDGRGLPTRTFTDRLTVGEGDDRIELFYFGRGHTDGDVWVLFPAARVLYTDIFIGKEMPIIDGGQGGSGLEYVETLTKAVSAFEGRVDRIVTGHGGMATIGDLREYADFCRDLVASVQIGKTAGRSADEIAGGWRLPPKYLGYTQPSPDLVLVNTQVIFKEIK